MNNDSITEEQFRRFIELQERFLSTMERVANRTDPAPTDAATPPDNVAPPSATDKPACDEQEITQRLARAENALIELQYVIRFWLAVYLQRNPYDTTCPSGRDTVTWGPTPFASKPTRHPAMHWTYPFGATDSCDA